MGNYVALPKIQINGQDAPAELIEDILQISVEESLHLPSMFTLVINNPYFPGRSQDKPWRYDDLLAIGKTVKIGYESSTTTAPEYAEEKEGYVIEGEITAIESHFGSESQAPVIVRGYDVSHRLHRGRYNRSFQNMTDSDIVKKVASEMGCTVGTVDASGGPHEYVFQENQTNMEFLRERAARLGFELFVQDGKLFFRQPSVDDPLKLKWLTNLHNFRVRVTTAEQVNSVEVRGWDYNQKQTISAIAQKEKVLTNTQQGNGKGAIAKLERASTAKMIVVDQPIANADEAQKIAQALYDELGGEFICADARGEGDPRIRPGRMIQLEDMGKYSGSYYVTETRHLYFERVYYTEFSVRGLRGGNLLAVLSPKTHLQPGQTHLVGIVTDNNDPQGWGRVKVKFPTLTEEHASQWARVVAAGAGNARGLDCLPEINDEVLVAFEHGDIHRPYIIGNVWNGKDAPPTSVKESVQNGKVRLRTLKTRVGHSLQFVEETKDASRKGAYLETAGGHKLRLNEGDRLVEIETTDGQRLRLNDSNNTITLTGNGDISVTAGKTGVAGKIQLNAGEIQLNATTRISLNVGTSAIEITQAGITIQTAGRVNVIGSLITLT